MSNPRAPGRVNPLRAVGVAFSWLTILPLPGASGRVDRRLGSAVMAAVPVVGAGLGAVAAGGAWALNIVGLPELMVGALVVTGLALLTRGMHLDGLADTADGLGCYGPPDRVAQVMRSGTVGPFGVASMVGVMLVQAVGFGALATAGRWWDLTVAVALGRVAAVLAARRGLGPAHADGFGALVAGTQRTSAIAWTALALGGAIAGTAFATPAFGIGAVIRAVVVVVLVAAFAMVFSHHCARRMGGIPGDVLGACIELGTAIAVVGFLV